MGVADTGKQQGKQSLNVGRRKIDRHYPRARILEYRRRVTQRRPHTRIEIALNRRPVYADPHPADSIFQMGQIIRNHFARGGRIVRIGAGDDAENGRRVGGAARHRTHRIEILRGGEDAVTADPTPGRLNAGDSIKRRRNPDRTAAVGAERTETEACRDGDSRSARRKAGAMVFIPRIEWSRNIGMMLDRRGFRHRQFAENDGPGLPQPTHNLRVQVCPVIGKDCHPNAGSNTLHIDHVLDG